MSKRAMFSFFRFLAFAAIAAFPIVGCESEDSPDDGDVDEYFDENPYSSDPRDATKPRDPGIEPSSYSVSAVGEKISFRAKGGKGPYSWYVSDNAKGTITPNSTTEMAVYRTLVVGPNSVTVYDKSGFSATAQITGPVEELVITASPSSITTDGGRSILNAAGGTPPYNWSVDDPDLGTIVGATTGSQVVYQRNPGKSGDNSVRCVDGAGNNAVIVIQQP